MENYEEVQYKPPQNPSAQEIDFYCQFLGLDPKEDKELLWIAIEGLKAPLPPDWIYYEHKTDDKVLFYNKKTGESIGHHPLDDHYFMLFQEEKKKLDQKKQKNRQQSNNSSQNGNLQNNGYKSMSTESLEQITTEYQNTLDKEIEELERKHEEKLDEIKLKQHLEMEREKRTLAEMKSKNDNLEKSKAKSFTDEKMKMQKDQYQEDIKMLKQDYENELKFLAEEHSKEISEQQKRYANELTELQSEQAKNIREIKRKHEQNVSKVKQENEKYLKTLTNQFEADKNAIITDNAKRLSLIQEEAQREKEEFLENHRKEIETMRRKHEEKIKQIKIKAANHLDSVNREFSISPSKEKLMQETNDQEIENRKKDQQRDLDKLEAVHQQKVKNIKEKNEQILRKIEAENDNKINSLRKSGEEELNRIKKQIELDKKKIYANIKREALSNSISTFSIDTIRVASVKPQNRRSKRATLKQSNPFALHLEEDENEYNLDMSRMITIFQKNSPIFVNTPNSDKNTTTKSSRKRIDDDNLTEVDFKSDSFDDSLDEFAQTDIRTQRLNRAADKAKNQFGNTAEKVSSEICSSIKDLDVKASNLRSYCAEQNRDLTKSAIEFQQRTLDVSKMFSSTLLELESAHRMAISALMQPRDVSPSVRPPVFAFTTPPPRYRRAQIISDDESSDLDSTTIRSIKNYMQEQKEAKTLNARLKKQDIDNL